MFYQFDIDRWIIHQLPPVLRTGAIFSFLKVFLYPVKQLLEVFGTYREAADLQLSYNAFTNYMQKWLNDVFFYTRDEIYITDEEFPAPALSFDDEGDAPVYVTAVDEDPAVALDLYSAPPGSKFGAFIVHVPPVMTQADIAVVEEWVNYYKFAGTQFRIEQYN